MSSQAMRILTGSVTPPLSSVARAIAPVYPIQTVFSSDDVGAFRDSSASIISTNFRNSG